jgi:hypothetical protein
MAGKGKVPQTNEPTFFNRVRPSQVDLAGFWTREQGESFCGVLLKYVPNDKKGPTKARPFFIFKVTSGKPTIAVEGEADTRTAESQECIGVAANWSMTSVVDKVSDIGKQLRLTVTGTADNPNGGKPMILIDVADVITNKSDEDVPF